MKQVRYWLNRVMNVLSKEANESSLESERQIEGKFDEIVNKFKNSNLPEKQKKQLVDMLAVSREKIMNGVKQL